MNCDKWTDQRDTRVGQRKNLESPTKIELVASRTPGGRSIFGRSLVRILSSGTQIFFFVPRSCHVDQFTFLISRLLLFVCLFLLLFWKIHFFIGFSSRCFSSIVVWIQHICRQIHTVFPLLRPLLKLPLFNSLEEIQPEQLKRPSK